MDTDTCSTRQIAREDAPAFLRAPGHRTTLARRGEDLAASHLERADGLEVVARNWRLSSGELRGELDLVAIDRDAGVIVVCEVKTRRSDRYGGPLAAVTPAKQAKIRRLTGAFLSGASLRYRRVRFDVVGIVLPEGDPPRLRHVKGAF